jgi:hypothetical protein
MRVMFPASFVSGTRQGIESVTDNLVKVAMEMHLRGVVNVSRCECLHLIAEIEQKSVTCTWRWRKDKQT